jgi:hypothetical protein
MPVPAKLTEGDVLTEDEVQTIERDLEGLEERIALLEVNVARVSRILQALAEKGDD